MWFHAKVRFVRRHSGAGEPAPLYELTGGDPDDPVVGIVCGHPAVELGTEFLLRDVLQIAMAPEDDRAWARLVRGPPSPEALLAKLEPYAQALDLDHPIHPLLQVRPEKAEGGNNLPVTALLPDDATSGFFGQAFGGLISAGLTPGLLYYSETLFPLPGGGFYTTPFGNRAIRYRVMGETLWERIALNLLPRDHPTMRGAPWPAPCDGSTFAWLDPALPAMPLGRKDEGARLSRGETHMHPAGIMMPRRYLLDPPVADGACMLSGVEGPAYASFTRWPGGIGYSFDRTLDLRRHFSVALRVTMKDGAPEDTAFLQSRGRPLRFDDWVGGLFEAEDGGGSKGRRAVRPPPVLKGLAARLERLGAEEGRVTSGLGGRLPYTVRAVTEYGGKVTEGVDVRETPLYDASEHVYRDMAVEAQALSAKVVEVADALKWCSRLAASQGNREAQPNAPDAHFDTLLARMDARLLAALDDLARHLAKRNKEALVETRRELAAAAAAEARRIFDAAYPIVGVGKVAAIIAGARRQLVMKLDEITGEREERAKRKAKETA